MFVLPLFRFEAIEAFISLFHGDRHGLFTISLLHCNSVLVVLLNKVRF